MTAGGARGAIAREVTIMEMPKVGREMQRLTELFVGSWRGDERLFPSTWDPVGGPAVGTWTVRAVAGGFANPGTARPSRSTSRSATAG